MSTALTRYSTNDVGSSSWNWSVTESSITAWICRTFCWPPFDPFVEPKGVVADEVEGRGLFSGRIHGAG